MPQLYSGRKYTQKRLTLRMQIIFNSATARTGKLTCGYNVITFIVLYAIVTLPCSEPFNNTLFGMPEQLRIDASKPMHESASIPLVLNRRS